MTDAVVIRLETGSAPDLADLIAPPRDARVFAARDGVGGRLLGAVALAAGPDDFAELHGLVVLPEVRRSGIARRLLAAAEAWARIQRIRTVRCSVPLTSEAALATARALGFVEIDQFGAHVGDPSSVCFARAI